MQVQPLPPRPKHIYQVINKTMKANLKQAKKFSKDIVYIRCHAIMFKDEHGEVVYTFDSKKKADEFFETLQKSAGNK